MEKFEQFRKNLADEIKNTPKTERNSMLELKKGNPEYTNVKELHRAKRGIYELSHTETLKNPEDLDEVVAWVKKELSEFTDRNEASMTDFKLEDFFAEIARYLTQRLKLDTRRLDNFKVAEAISNTTFSEHASDDEGTIHGILYLMSREVIKYSSYSDGYAFSIDELNDYDLRMSVRDLIVYLKDDQKG